MFLLSITVLIYLYIYIYMYVVCTHTCTPAHLSDAWAERLMLHFVLCLCSVLVKCSVLCLCSLCARSLCSVLCLCWVSVLGDRCFDEKCQRTTSPQTTKKIETRQQASQWRQQDTNKMAVSTPPALRTNWATTHPNQPPITLCVGFALILTGVHTPHFK